MRLLAIFLAILIAGSIGVSAFGVHTDSLSGTKIKAKLLSQEPNPVQPGEIITLKFKIENNGTETKSNVKATIIAEHPFTAYGKDTADLGNLQAGQTGADAAIVEFRLKVSADATEGTETIKLNVDSQVFEFDINIQTRETVLSIEEIGTRPIEPGEDAKFWMTIANNADSMVRDIKIKLNLTGVPFAPSKTTAEKYVYSLQPKAGKKIDFDIIALPDADGGIHKIPFTLSFSDAVGTEYSSDGLFSVRVAGEPDLILGVNSFVLETGELSVKITNRGLTDIKYLTAKLGDGKYDVISESEVYIGNIDTDDYETGDFKLKLNGFDKVITLPLSIKYRDVLNKEHNENLQLSLRTGNKGLALTILGAAFKWIIILGVLSGIGYGAYYWFYKR